MNDTAIGIPVWAVGVIVTLMIPGWLWALKRLTMGKRKGDGDGHS